MNGGVSAGSDFRMRMADYQAMAGTNVGAMLNGDSTPSDSIVREFIDLSDYHRAIGLPQHTVRNALDGMAEDGENAAAKNFQDAARAYARAIVDHHPAVHQPANAEAAEPLALTVTRTAFTDSLKKLGDAFPEESKQSEARTATGNLAALNADNVAGIFEAHCVELLRQAQAPEQLALVERLKKEVGSKGEQAAAASIEIPLAPERSYTVTDQGDLKQGARAFVDELIKGDPNDATLLRSFLGNSRVHEALGVDEAVAKNLLFEGGGELPQRQAAQHVINSARSLAKQMSSDSYVDAADRAPTNFLDKVVKTGNDRSAVGRKVQEAVEGLTTAIQSLAKTVEPTKQRTMLASDSASLFATHCDRLVGDEVYNAKTDLREIRHTAEGFVAKLKQEAHAKFRLGTDTVRHKF